MRRLLLLPMLLAGLAAGSEYHGVVLFNGVPVPGAELSAVKGNERQAAVTDERGLYSFPNLSDGEWTIDVDMTGFSRLEKTVAISPSAAAGQWELTMLPAAQILATPGVTGNAQMPPADQAAEEDAMEGLLISGSEDNALTSVHRLDAAFGNNRRRAAALYNGSIGVILDNSALDAAPFSLTGQATPKPSYSDVTGVVTLGGPLRIPHLIENGPTFFVGYQWTRDRNAVDETALVPTVAQRSLPGASAAAQSLLALYPLPNFNGNSRYNFQLPAVSAMHQDALQARADKTIKRNDFSGMLALQSLRKDTPNVLGYSDATSTFGLNTKVNWSRALRHAMVWNASYDFSRLSTGVMPYFANKTDVSAAAGIAGNDQAAIDWGPPTLVFASGIASLTDANPMSDHDQTSTVGSSIIWTHRTHSVTAGADYRREQLNYRMQQNPRGTLAFTGAATGSDFEDFLEGIPDTSSIAFGNADKYLREAGYDGYVADDWRVNASLTMNAGLRWEYAAPISELDNRLANLAVGSDFRTATPIVAGSANVSRGLVQPDRDGWQPRVGVAWRAPSGSSLVVRAGYGIYYDNGVYENLALQLAQQPPFSKTFSVENSAANPLTLVNAFTAPAGEEKNTFAIDPRYRIGYAQSWQVSVQRDLTWSLIGIATYSGIKGTRGPQEFLPNTVAPGGVNGCGTCPNGFVYLASNGNSSREALKVELRRRLHNGFTAQLLYTFSKSLDDDSYLGGQGTTTPTSNDESGGLTAPVASNQPAAEIAQNWLNLSAERGRSSFDQRHVLSAQLQYTSGMGAKGGTLLTGWRGALAKEWTLATRITAGSGLPEDPVYFATVPGTGFTGTVRPNYTGAPLYKSPSGFFLNPDAFVAPNAGEWGNAGRNSITGPMQFKLDATLGRTFRLKDKLNLDLRFDATNALNHVTYTAWNTVINNAQFGLPVSANAMRSVQTTLRLRF